MTSCGSDVSNLFGRLRHRLSLSLSRRSRPVLKDFKGLRRVSKLSEPFFMRIAARFSPFQVRQPVADHRLGRSLLELHEWQQWSQLAGGGLHQRGGDHEHVPWLLSDAFGILWCFK